MKIQGKSWNLSFLSLWNYQVPQVDCIKNEAFDFLGCFATQIWGFKKTIVQHLGFLIHLSMSLWPLRANWVNWLWDNNVRDWAETFYVERLISHETELYEHHWWGSMIWFCCNYLDFVFPLCQFCAAVLTQVQVPPVWMWLLPRQKELKPVEAKKLFDSWLALNQS